MNPKGVERLMKRHRVVGVVPRRRRVTPPLLVIGSLICPGVTSAPLGLMKPGPGTSSATRSFLIVRW